MYKNSELENFFLKLERGKSQERYSKISRGRSAVSVPIVDASSRGQRSSSGAEIRSKRRLLTCWVHCPRDNLVKVTNRSPLFGLAAYMLDAERAAVPFVIINSSYPREFHSSFLNDSSSIIVRVFGGAPRFRRSISQNPLPTGRLVDRPYR